MGQVRIAALVLMVGSACAGPAPTSPPDAATADAATADAAAPAPVDAGTPEPPADAGSVPDAAPPIDAGERGDASAPQDGGGPATGDGCGRPAPSPGSWSLMHEGRMRTFLVHLPPTYDPATPTPVVFDLHGRLFTAEAQLDLTRMDQVADAEGFVVVHPQGIGRTWNGGVCCGEAMRDDVDDVGFVAAMLDRLEAQLCVDERRVFATGMSNGGFMAHRLACELSDRIAAIAPVAGMLGVSPCEPARPVPVLHFHGDDDQVVRYGGFGGFLSAVGSSEQWAEMNGCDATSQVTFSQDDVTCRTWSNCSAGATVELCTIAGGGHTWPGGSPLPLLGRTTQTVSASARAWAFFEAHPRP